VHPRLSSDQSWWLDPRLPVVATGAEGGKRWVAGPVAAAGAMRADLFLPSAQW
jgi:hypothetical protein